MPVVAVGGSAVMTSPPVGGVSGGRAVAVPADPAAGDAGAGTGVTAPASAASRCASGSAAACRNRSAAWVLQAPAATAWIAVTAIATLVGLACYLVFYRLDPAVAYWIGMVPRERPMP